MIKVDGGSTTCDSPSVPLDTSPSASSSNTVGSSCTKGSLLPLGFREIPLTPGPKRLSVRPRSKGVVALEPAALTFPDTRPGIENDACLEDGRRLCGTEDSGKPILAFDNPRLCRHAGELGPDAPFAAACSCCANACANDCVSNELVAAVVVAFEIAEIGDIGDVAAFSSSCCASTFSTSFMTGGTPTGPSRASNFGRSRTQRPSSRAETRLP